VWRWEQQKPFGVNVADENPSSLGMFEFPLRFPGQYADKETNLYYNFFRDFDAAIGRYIESDPIELEGGLNTYAYVFSAPLLDTDPNGLFSTKLMCGNPANAAACAAAGMTMNAGAGGMVGGATSLVVNVTSQLSQMECPDPSQINWTQAAGATATGVVAGVAMGPLVTAPAAVALWSLTPQQVVPPVVAAVALFTLGTQNPKQALSFIQRLMNQQQVVRQIQQASKKGPKTVPKQ